jgi:hypothetical protein
LQRVERAPAYRGEVVYIYAFDIAYELKRREIVEVLGQPVAQFAVDASKRNPRRLFFYRTQMIRLPALERLGPRGPIRLERAIKLLPVGALSVTVRVPFEVERIEDLVAYHDLRFADGVSLYDEVVELAEQVRVELQPYCVKPAERLNNEEAYTVFCLQSPLPGAGASAQEWMQANRRAVAALLTEEPHVQNLSEQESEDSTNKFISYYDTDLVVIDWDAALVIDEPRHFAETVYLMELANVQLAELEAYDEILDGVVDRSYRDLARRPPLLGYGHPVQQSLREIRIDLARLSDELQNSTKFIGDWHMARIYRAISERFHLADWHKMIDQKLETLDNMYQLLQSDRNNRMMITLEIMIVVLFIIDVVIIFMHGQ